jgi:uncharacterized membrane protein YeaQ/YmgE (transglycosylase-associated protein family)
MGLFEWIIFAAVVGIIATFIDTSSENGGFIGGIILSITGTLLALFIANLVFNLPATLTVTSILVAFYGAAMFILTGRGLRRL